MIAVNNKAPDFNLPDENGLAHSLSSYNEGWLVLYFYPKDDTPGCTIEACNFRDAQAEFHKVNAQIVGVSSDSVASHKKFADKHSLPFTLLADEQKVTVSNYGVWQKKKMMGREYMGIVRSSFLIDQKGIVRKVYESVNPLTHVKHVLADIKELNDQK